MEQINAGTVAPRPGVLTIGAVKAVRQDRKLLRFIDYMRVASLHLMVVGYVANIAPYSGEARSITTAAIVARLSPR